VAVEAVVEFPHTPKVTVLLVAQPVLVQIQMLVLVIQLPHPAVAVE
jgi:hypothetical protein